MKTSLIIIGVLASFGLVAIVIDLFPFVDVEILLIATFFLLGLFAGLIFAMMYKRERDFHRKSIDSLINMRDMATPD